ncbi:hypothetical protein QBC47DRAFT_395602 [Echria macrotheca]|uniref:DUF6594 domain-containing protein n=1 Tax=Echria macrotheca TaxID=438768 RepID=A0AAJ0B1Q7_9PEZI|nr:hypothetical protein QBC47DRAFT_395602 [Echria macrotheca]
MALDLPHREGLPGFGDLLAQDIDRSSMVFHRFDLLAMRNLVYMQNELQDLQSRLKNQDQSDIDARKQDILDGHPDKDTVLHRVDWTALEAASKIANPELLVGDVKEAKERWELIMTIRKRLEKYRTALIQQWEINRLDPPTVKTHHALLSAIDEPHQERFQRDIEALYCTAAVVDENPNKMLALASLRSPLYDDRLTSWVDKHFTWGIKKDNTYSRVAYYSLDSIRWRSSLIFLLFSFIWIGGTLCALYPMCTKLNCEDAVWFELLFILICTLLFLGFCSILGMPRTEMFGTVFGYLSILLVFVSLNKAA